MKAATLSVVIAFWAANPSWASSSDAWADFAAEVEAKCLALVEEELTEATVRVDPFGSERFGLALVSGQSFDSPVERVCVMDKESGEAEIGGELPR